MNINRYKELESKYSENTVMVIGDLMLDNYLWGQATRISPEAPVPIIKVESTSSNPGGAANVVNNLAALGSHVIACGVVGDDQNGALLKSIIEGFGSDVTEIIVDPNRPTTVKTRVIAHNQQVIRTDWEDTSQLNKDISDTLLQKILDRMDDCNAVILEDYNKGLLYKDFIQIIISECEQRSIPVYADPKIDHFFDYRGVSLFKPNLGEAFAALDKSITTENDIFVAGRQIMDKLSCEMVLLTRGEKGMVLFDSDGHHDISTKARNVHDVSGAGDTVISVFCLTHISGATPIESAIVANYAAGRVCEDVGVVPITKENLYEIITHHNS